MSEDKGRAINSMAIILIRAFMATLEGILDEECNIDPIDALGEFALILVDFNKRLR